MPCSVQRLQSPIKVSFGLRCFWHAHLCSLATHSTGCHWRRLAPKQGAEPLPSTPRAALHPTGCSLPSPGCSRTPANTRPAAPRTINTVINRENPVRWLRSSSRRCSWGPGVPAWLHSPQAPRQRGHVQVSLWLGQSQPCPTEALEAGDRSVLDGAAPAAGKCGGVWLYRSAPWLDAGPGRGLGLEPEALCKAEGHKEGLGTGAGGRLACPRVPKDDGGLEGSSPGQQSSLHQVRTCSWRPGLRLAPGPPRGPHKLKKMGSVKPCPRWA